MTHLADGTLRRVIDEPHAISETDNAHLESCVRCRARQASFARDAGAVATLLEVPELRTDSAVALRRLRAPATPSSFRLPFVIGARRWLAAAAAIVLVAFTLTTTGVADSFIQIFEPKQFVAIPITPGDLNAIPDLSAYGTMTWSGAGKDEWTNAAHPFTTTNAATARAKSGLAVLTPAALPANADPGSVQFRVLQPARMTFTFDGSKARDAASRASATPPPMPSHIDGAQLYIDVGPVVLQLYKVGSSGSDMSGLGIVEARPPVVSSNGVTVKELQDYLLSQPGISPELAARVRAIADPQTTLPVPVPVNYTFTRSVTVQGQPGLLLGDSTGVFSGVFWRAGDVVRAVAGPLTDTTVLDIANSLR